MDQQSQQAQGVTCDRCGATGLKWHPSRFGWRLSGPDGRVHKCKSESKFGNKPTRVESLNRSFQSRLEARRAQELKFLEEQGIISDLRFQPQVYLSAAKIGYKPDFHYFEGEGDRRIEVYEDAKGKRTERFDVCVALWAIYGPAQLRITMDVNGRIRTVRTVYPDYEKARDQGDL